MVATLQSRQFRSKRRTETTQRQKQWPAQISLPTEQKDRVPQLHSHNKSQAGDALRIVGDITTEHGENFPFRSRPKSCRPSKASFACPSCALQQNNIARSRTSILQCETVFAKKRHVLAINYALPWREPVGAHSCAFLIYGAHTRGGQSAWPRHLLAMHTHLIVERRTISIVIRFKRIIRFYKITTTTRTNEIATAVQRILRIRFNMFVAIIISEIITACRIATLIKIMPTLSIIIMFVWLAPNANIKAGHWNACTACYNIAIHNADAVANNNSKRNYANKFAVCAFIL